MARHRPRHRLEGLRRQDRDLSQPVETRVQRQRMMHAPGAGRDDAKEKTAIGNPLVAALARALSLINTIIVVFAALALIAACGILSYSVIGRALFQAANYWQDEAAVFLLVGATFMTTARSEER